MLIFSLRNILKYGGIATNDFKEISTWEGSMILFILCFLVHQNARTTVKADTYISRSIEEKEQIGNVISQKFV